MNHILKPSIKMINKQGRIFLALSFLAIAFSASACGDDTYSSQPSMSNPYGLAWADGRIFIANSSEGTL
ncbi:hypothetical protein KAI87_05345, partial [Myxococcota bacterium]|nr:hypothetical protein [Myxococcota bacterium]